MSFPEKKSYKTTKHFTPLLLHRRNPKKTLFPNQGRNTIDSNERIFSPRYINRLADSNRKNNLDVASWSQRPLFAKKKRQYNKLDNCTVARSSNVTGENTREVNKPKRKHITLRRQISATYLKRNKTAPVRVLIALARGFFDINRGAIVTANFTTRYTCMWKNQIRLNAQSLLMKFSLV